MIAVLLTAAMVAVAAVWCLTPFALFGVRSRLATIEDAYRRHTEEVIAELQRVNEVLQAEGHRILLDPKASDRTLLVRNTMGRA